MDSVSGSAIKSVIENNGAVTFFSTEPKNLNDIYNVLLLIFLVLLIHVLRNFIKSIFRNFRI